MREPVSQRSGRALSFAAKSRGENFIAAIRDLERESSARGKPTHKIGLIIDTVT